MQTLGIWSFTSQFSAMAAAISKLGIEASKMETRFTGFSGFGAKLSELGTEMSEMSIGSPEWDIKLSRMATGFSGLDVKLSAIATEFSD